MKSDVATKKTKRDKKRTNETQTMRANETKTTNEGDKKNERTTQHKRNETKKTAANDTKKMKMRLYAIRQYQCCVLRANDDSMPHAGV